MHPVPKQFSTNLSRSTLVALFGVLLFASPTLQGQSGSLVANGGFEDNADLSGPVATAPLTAWTVGEVLGTPPTPMANRVDGLDPTVPYALGPHTGNIAAAFNSNIETVTTGGLATLSQALTTSAAQLYDLRFWLANPIQDSTDFNNVFSVSWNGGLLALSNPSLTEVGMSRTYIVKPNTTWFQVTAPNLLATASSTDLVFSARNSDWATLLDDVSVVPEPTALLMLGAGTLLLGLRRRRRARF